MNTPRSVVVDDDLRRTMLRDTVIYVFTRPLALIAWIVLAVALVLVVSSLVVQSAYGEVSGTTAWMPFAVLVVMGFFAVSTITSAKRSLHAAMPLGSRVRAEIGAERLELASAQGTSSIEYSTFKGVRIGRGTVLLQLRGTSVVTAIPRALVSDDEIAHLKSVIS